MAEKQKREMGARICELRETLGLRQEQIADYCDVSVRAYQFWQAGDVVPDPEHLQKLAEIFQTTTKFILRGETPDTLKTLNDDRKGKLDLLAEQISDLHELLIGDHVDAELVAGIAARLLATVESPQPQADAPENSPPAADERNDA